MLKSTVMLNVRFMFNASLIINARFMLNHGLKNLHLSIEIKLKEQAF